MVIGHHLLVVVVVVSVWMPMTLSVLPPAQWSPVEGPRISKQEGEYCFSYDENSIVAPHLWYRICGSFYTFFGANQSPVMIDPRFVWTFCSPENRLRYDSHDSVTGTLENDGYYAKFTDIEGERKLYGVPGYQYTGFQLGSIHIHIGKRNGLSRRTEHEVFRRQYDAEIHMVHSRGAGSGQVAGLAVVAIFLSTYEGEENEEINRLLDKVENIIEYEGDVCEEFFTNCDRTYNGNGNDVENKSSRTYHNNGNGNGVTLEIDNKSDRTDNNNGNRNNNNNRNENNNNNGNNNNSGNGNTNNNNGNGKNNNDANGNNNNKGTDNNNVNGNEDDRIDPKDLDKVCKFQYTQRKDYLSYLQRLYGRRISSRLGEMARRWDSEYCFKEDEQCPHHGTGEHDCGGVDLEINPEKLLPSSRDYYYYYGSLTTATLSESVLWQVMMQPLRITVEQLERLEALESRIPDALISDFGNTRPLQKLNGRRILANVCG